MFMTVTALTRRWLAGGVGIAESRLSDFKELPSRFSVLWSGQKVRKKNRSRSQKKDFSESLKPCVLERRIYRHGGGMVKKSRMLVL